MYSNNKKFAILALIPTINLTQTLYPNINRNPNSKSIPNPNDNLKNKKEWMSK